jgi:hypothetical protein
MKMCFLPLSVMLLCSGAKAQSSDTPGLSLRMMVTPAGSAWVGQHVAVTVIVRTPIRFVGPVVFPDLAVGGRSIVLPNGASTPGVEREGNRTYAVVQHRYDLFPSGTGALTIGPLTMTLPVVGDDGTTSQTAEAAARPMAVGLPTGAGDLSRMLTASQARIGVSTDGDPSHLPVGQAITRTVTVTAVDTTSMLIPAMQWTASAGVRVYPDPPRLTDGTDRGILSAGRVDRASFVPEALGRYVLPGASIQWFNPQDGKMTDLTVEPMEIVAVPAATVRQTSWRPYLLVAAAFVIACGGAWFLLVLNRSPSPEKAAYRALRKACRGSDPTRTARAFYRWSTLAGASGTLHTAHSIAVASGTPSLAEEAEVLAAQCYGAPRVGQSWNGRRLRKAVRIARAALRSHRGGHALRARTALPDLNPSA